MPGAGREGRGWDQKGCDGERGGRWGWTLRDGEGYGGDRVTRWEWDGHQGIKWDMVGTKVDSGLDSRGQGEM